jgi:hypothetical protein
MAPADARLLCRRLHAVQGAGVGSERVHDVPDHWVGGLGETEAGAELGLSSGAGFGKVA